MTKDKIPSISPKVFDAIQADYTEAARLRRGEIRRLYNQEGWTQQEIADYFGIDISRVNRIINKEKE